MVSGFHTEGESDMGMQETVDELGNKVAKLETGHAVLHENHQELRRRVDDAHSNIDALTASHAELAQKFGEISGSMATKQDVLEITHRISAGFENVQRQYGENYKAVAEAVPAKVMLWLTGAGIIVSALIALIAFLSYAHHGG